MPEPLRPDEPAHTAERDTSVDAPGPLASIPERIGRYKLRRVIASGGMGTVFEAMQDTPRRAVALKVMRHGVTSRSALRRFEFESQILARLRHPGIAQVYEAGTHDDGGGAVPFFAMEYVPGARTLTEFARHSRLSLRQRLELFAGVCDAVAHGHQKGIIHRDLKPGNVLVDSSGQPKVIDFGVARATDSDLAVTTLQTDVGQLIGTLQYMSPEQCAADPHDLDVRSDVYALGVMLYELLCDRLPYDIVKVPMHEATRVIREQPPPRPGTIDGALRGDVETIALKALEKDRLRRYQSATALADDIRRHLRHEPIEARPLSLSYHLKMFARRNRAMVAGALIAVAALLAGATLAAWWAVKYTLAWRQAERQSQIAGAVNDFLNRDLLASVAPEEMGRDVTMRQVLDAASAKIAGRFDDPLVEASVRQTLGTTYKRLGAYDAAEPHLEASLRLHREALGLEDPRTLSAMCELGSLLTSRGRFAEAEPVLLQASEVARSSLGLEHERTLDAMNLLAILYRNMSRYEQAETLYDTVLELRRRTIGPDDPATIGTMANIAVLLQEQGRYAEAEKHFRDALAAHRRVLGEEHRGTLKIMNNLASLYSRLERFDEAEPLLLAVLEGSARTLGEEHHDTLLCMNSLAVMYMRMKRYDDAERTYRGALDIYGRTLGLEHPHALNCANNFATLCEQVGRTDEAEGIFLHTLEARRRVLGETHQDTLVSLSNLGGLYNTLRSFEQGLPLHEEAVEGARHALAKGHFLGGVFLRKRGECLTGLQRYADAERDLLEARDILEAARQPAPIRQAREALVALYEAWGRPEDAQKWRPGEPE